MDNSHETSVFVLDFLNPEVNVPVKTAADDILKRKKFLFFFLPEKIRLDISYPEMSSLFLGKKVQTVVYYKTLSGAYQSLG